MSPLTARAARVPSPPAPRGAAGGTRGTEADASRRRGDPCGGGTGGIGGTGTGTARWTRQRRPRRPRGGVRAALACLLGGFAGYVYCRRGHYLGPGTLAGGTWGRAFDNSVRTVLWTWHQHRARQEVRDRIGADVFATVEDTNRVGVPVLTEAWARAAASAAWRRRRGYEAATAPGAGGSEAGTDCRTLPLLQPLVGDWYRPIAATNASRSVLWVDRATMEAFLYQAFPDLVSVYQRYNSQQSSELWALGHVAIHGGRFVHPSTLLSEAEPREDCPLRIQVNARGDLELLQAPPKHPLLACILQRLSLHASHGRGAPWKDVLIWMVTEHERSQLMEKGPRDLAETCLEPDNQLPPAFVPLYTLRDALPEPEPLSPDACRWKIEFRYDDTTSDAAPRPSAKNPWSRRLNDKGCHPGWICHRCLRLPWFGSHQSCQRWTCPDCYLESLCLGDTNHTGAVASEGGVADDHHPTATPEIRITVQVLEARNRTTLKRIPRIIHQTWFEELSLARYPHLQRLQNSWKTMPGWDYRFYTDLTAREFIERNLPDIFLTAYDALAVPAFKADFFRLCVLAVHGGVYADIDVMLETNLDYFITSNMSLFIPRDVNIDIWPNANYCVWNGLLGSSPGHPVVLQALEDLVNRALNRHDYFDVESHMCRRDLTAEVWKLRCSPMLLLTGPCALGMSLSEALGRSNPLEGWHIGWQATDQLSTQHSYDWGDVLILLLDRYDFGEQRFTDIERNLLLASTNQDRIATRPLHDVIEDHKHYSSYESDIVGSRIYKDDHSHGGQIRLRIEHIYR